MIIAKYLTRGLVFLFALLLLGSSCKKKRAFEDETAQDAVDIRFTQGECDEIIKDVNTVIMEQYLLRGRNSDLLGTTEGSTTTVCGVKLDTILLTKGIVTMNFDGSNCSGRSRTGSVRFTIQGYPVTKWKHSGCTILVEYLSYKSTQPSTGHSITMSGTSYLINESGNTWYELWYLSEPSVTNRMTGDGIKVVFDDGNYGKFSFDRRLTFTYKNKVTTCKVEGLATANNRSMAENWGLSRRGENFVSQVNTPYIWKTSCGPIAPLSGEVTIMVSEKEYDLKNLFGVSSYGDDLKGGDVPCPYGWKTSWSRKNKTNSRIFSYF
ncbi:MAG: hypothetical protein PSX36_14415 [bacterium]|nr:hypothetical protein [bacterium]